MAIQACKVISAAGLVRLNAMVADAVAQGFAPHGDIMPVADGELVLIMVKRDTGIDGCTVISADGLIRLSMLLADAVVDGFSPHGDIITLPSGDYVMVLVKGGDSGGGTGDITSAQISDATTVGKSVLTAADAAAARTAIGAGTSNLAIGTTSTTAKAGNYAPTWAEVTGKPAVIGAGADAAAARAAIGAGIGNSNLVIGTTATQAKAGNWKPVVADITDSGDFGRQLLQCADQAAAKTLLGIA
jgi:hypothetical protein